MSELAATQVPQAKVARPNPLRRRDFRLLWSGQAVSSLGDQFALVALPWLALIITGSSLALGGVLAVMAVPRAGLMLFGGVFVDRLSPRRVMFASNVVRLVCVTVLGLVAIEGGITIAMLYVFALVFGIADAFFYPAQQAIIPVVVVPDEIPAANALAQGTTQLTVFVGPGIAGVLIAALGTTGAHTSMTGVGGALLVDAASFVVSLVSLAMIRAGAALPSVREPVFDALKAGLAFVWGWPSVRFVVFFAMAVNLFIVGPLAVGLPVLAYSRLPEGAAGYGTIMSAMGLGALLGMVAVMAIPQPRPARLGTFVVAIIGVGGLAVAGLALATSILVVVLLVAVAGFVTGYGNLMLITWAQQRIPRQLMGRVFSLILLGSMALIPVSQVIAGALVTVSLDGTFIVAGLSMTVLSLVSAMAPAVRGMGLEPLAGGADS